MPSAHPTRSDQSARAASGPADRRRTPGRDIAVIAVFAGITAALGFLPAFYTPISPSPLTAQSFGTILAGAILGARRGGLSQLLFMALVALGLPLLAGGRGGVGVFASATVGFLVAYVVVPFLIGWATERVGAPYRFVPGLLINAAFGIVVMYLFGAVGMMAVMHLSVPAAALAVTPFIIGDSIKVVLATATAVAVHKSYPGLLPLRGRLGRDAASA